MRALILALFIAIAPAHAAELRIVREISFIPCVGDPLYIFVFENGNVAMFNLRVASEDAEIREILLKHLDKAILDTKLKEIVLKQNNCGPEDTNT